MKLRSETDLHDGEERSEAYADGEEGGEQDGNDLGAAMHIVLDDLFQPDAHMDGGGEDERGERQRDERPGEEGVHVGVARADMGDDRQDEKDDERHIGDRRQALAPEGLGAVMGGAEAANTLK